MLKTQKSRNLIFLTFRVVVTLLIAFIFTIPAYADTDKTDLSVGMKILPLLADKITGTATLSIIFDPQNTASKQEAEKIKTIMDGETGESADLKLATVLVPANDLGKMAQSKVTILTSGLSAYCDSIGVAVAGKGILTMSTDLTCVKAGKCIIGIVSKPEVEIYYNKQAAINAKVVFGQVFALLVKEI